MVKAQRSHGFTFVGLGRHNAIKKVFRLLSANETGGAQFEFWATSETNFVWIGCTSRAQETVTNSAQCLLFIEGLDKYIISEVTFTLNVQMRWISYNSIHFNSNLRFL